MNDFLPLSGWATRRRGRCQGRRRDADVHLGLALGSFQVRPELRSLHMLFDLMPLPFRSGPEAAERGAAPAGPEVPEYQAPLGRVRAGSRTGHGVSWVPSTDLEA